MGATDKITYALVLFDGACNLCNHSVQFIIKRDKAQYFTFAALQSDLGRDLLSKHGIPSDTPQSIVLIKGGDSFQKSRAVLEIAGKLEGTRPLFYLLLIIPRFIQDWVYNMISANRYRLFGRQEKCMTPTPALKSRFVG